MLKKLFRFAAIAVGLSALAYGLYQELRLQQWNEAHTEMSRLETLHGKCTTSTEYGYRKTECPTKEMGVLRGNLQQMERELSDAEQIRTISFLLVIVGPLLVMVLGDIVTGALFPIATKGIRAIQHGAQRLGSASASTSQRAVTSASRMANSAKGRTKECPFCAEMIKPQAKVCIHCGRDVN